MKTESETRMITPKQAEILLRDYNFEQNRTLRKWHISNLARKMSNGDFLKGTQLRFAESPNLKRLTDGQHRLLAVVQCGKPVEFTVVTVHVDSDEDISKDYGAQGRDIGRTPYDYIRARGLNAKMNVSAALVNRMFAGLRSLYNNLYGVHRNKIAHEELEKWAYEYLDEITYYLTVISGNTSHEPFLLRAPVVACALLTFKHQQKKAEEFWTKLANDDGLRKGDPCKTLLAFLKKLYYEKKLHSSASEQVAVKAISVAWNAAYTGKSISFVRTTDVRRVSFKGVPLKQLREIDHLHI